MMRKLTTIAAIAAFLGLFAACSSNSPITENDENGENNIAQENQTHYVKVSIHGGNSFNTRAAENDGNPVEGDFQAGVGNESEISTIYFVFYDDEGNIVGNIVNVPLTTPKNTTSENTVEKIYENTVSVSLLKGQAKPSQVMCYINPISLNDIQQPLSVIQTITRERVHSADEKKLFPMSNSVYYPNNEEATLPVIAVSVNGKVYDTQEEADGAAEGVDIYVERRAARLTFKLKDGIYDNDRVVKAAYTSAGAEGYPSYEAAFHIEGWDVNAQAKVTYMVKSFRQRDAATAAILAENFTYKSSNDIINKEATTGAWMWNNSAFHRSYWGISPAYFVAHYPEVASDVNESEDLLYIKPKGYTWKTALNGGTPEYYREATVGHDALESKNPAAAVASVVLKGYYTINNKEVDFYTYQKDGNGKFFIFPKNEGDMAAGGMTMLNRFIQLQSVLYKINAETGVYEKITLNDLGTAYTTIQIQHPEKYVLGADKAVEGSEELKVASRQQTLQLTGVPGNDLYYASGNGYDKIDESNLRAVNLALIHQLGFASFYNKGQAYFNIPIKHLGWYRGANTQKDARNIDWSIVRVGDFGMVRNHVYNIEVESITGLGTGIGNPTDPIIPPAESKDYYVKYRVNCLKWAVVPKQSVNL